jgi:hypothetical protein
MSTGNRRLFFHGFAFFALAPISGLLIVAPVANPRAMLSLHLALWLSGAVMCGAAAAWPHLATGRRTQTWTEGGLILGMWIGVALALVPALIGTSTLFVGGGNAPAWAESLQKALQVGITITLTPALFLMVIGLGKRRLV